MTPHSHSRRASQLDANGCLLVSPPNRPQTSGQPNFPDRQLRPPIERVVTKPARATWEAARTIHSEQAS